MTNPKRLRTLERAVKRLAPPATITAAYDGVVGAAWREVLEGAADPLWPPWPADRDSDWQRWIESHWSADAVTELQALEVAMGDARHAALAAIAEELQDHPDAEILARLPEWGFEVPPPAFQGSVVEWLGGHYGVTSANLLRGAISNAVHRRRHPKPWGPNPAARAQEHYLKLADLQLRIVRHELDPVAVARLATRYVRTPHG